MDDPLKLANDALDKALETEKRNKRLIESIGPAVVNMLAPTLQEVAQAINKIPEAIQEAVSKVKIDAPIVPEPKVTVNVPETKLPPINIPKADVNVTYPEGQPDVHVTIPPIKLPPAKPPTVKVTMATKALTNEIRAVKKAISEQKPIFQPNDVFDKVSFTKPLPVILTDNKGKPYISMPGMGANMNNVMRFMDGNTARPVSSSFPLPITGSITTTPGATFYASDAVASTNTIQLGGNDIATNSGVTNAGTQRIVQAVDSVSSVYVTGFATSIQAQLVNPDGSYPGAGGSSSAGTQYNDGATPDQSGGIGTISMLFDGGSAQSWSGSSYGVGNVLLTDFDSSVYSISNPLPIRLATVTDYNQSVNVASQSFTFDVKQVSGTIDSVSVTGFTASVGATILNGEGLARDSWLVSDITNSVKAALIDSSGVQYSGTNPVPVTGTVTVSGITNSVAVSLQTDAGNSAMDEANDSARVSIVNPLSGGAVYVYSEFIESQSGDISTIAGAVQVEDAAHADGDNGILALTVRNTNNTTFADNGDYQPMATDKIGRQLTRPIQVRDLMTTAYATLSTGTETTLLAGAASTFHDLVYVMGANTSDAATQIDFRSGTGGSVMFTLEIPSGGTAGVSLPVPIPQTEVAQAWTVDMPDITGTTVYLSALFSKEV